MNASSSISLRSRDEGLELSAITKRFGKEEALSEVNLTIASGEVLALVGPSGAGKTTLCRIIAGLDQPNRGKVFFGGRDLTDMHAGNRRVAMMFESYALYPHLTVRENIL